MQKQEFEERIERTVTDEQYKVIEEVYIKNPFFFQKKVFYWGTKEEQKEIYVLEEGETILSLNKYGDLWEAETIAIPWIHHSQEVEVQHSKYSGIVTVEKTIVRSDDTGAVHMYIYFAGGEKDV